MSLMRPVAAAAAAATLAGACTVGPNYVKPDLPAPPAYAEAASTQRTAVTPRDADLSRWWTQFGDPVLDGLIQRALAQNLDLQSAASRVREARAQERVAAAAELPTLSASGNAVKYDSQRKSSDVASTSASGGASSAATTGLAGIPIPSHLNLYSAGFDASWEVDLFGGTRRAIEAAKDTVEATEWARRDGQVSMLAEVANAYLSLRALQTRIVIGREELQRQKDQFQLIRARREQGFVTGLDVNQQSVQVAAAAAQIPQLEAAASAQIHALGVLLGQTPESLAQELTVAPSDALLPPPPPTLPTGLPSQLLQRRPDLRQAERRLAAANAQVGVETANLYPKLNLIALATFASPKVEDLLSTQNFSTLGLGMLSAPIFEGGRTRASIAAAKEEREQALLAYGSAVLGAFRDVEDALARFKSEDTRRANLVQSVAASQNSLKIAQDQYAAGIVTYINVVQAQNAVLNSRDQLAQSDAQALSDLVAVYKALGGGWDL
jgi:NodT family efflux transporter outer membrane factor (OMF) lipoprotein